MLENVQRAAARHACNNYHNTSSVTNMLSDLNWQPLHHRRLRTRLITFYKITNNKIAIPYIDIRHLTNTGTRKSQPHIYRHISCKKDSYKQYRLNAWARWAVAWGRHKA